MKALLGGELRRTLARRLVRVVFLVVTLGIVLAGVITFLKSHPLSEAAYQARVRSAEAQFNAPDGFTACPSGPDGQAVTKGPGPAPGQPGEQPACIPKPLVTVHDPRLHLTSLKGVFEGVTAPLVLISCLIGASIIGAEWPTRTITTILTWEPRRFRVLTAKLLSALVVGVVLTAVALVVLGAALLPSALLHGTTMGTTGAWWRSVGGVLLRSMAMAAIATTIGFSIASVGRNTAAALGALFGYIIVVENVVARVVDWGNWLLVGNAFVLVSGTTNDFVHHRSVAVAGLYLTAIALGLFAVAAVLFQRRDVA